MARLHVPVCLGMVTETVPVLLSRSRLRFSSVTIFLYRFHWDQHKQRLPQKILAKQILRVERRSRGNALRAFLLRPWLLSTTFLCRCGRKWSLHFQGFCLLFMWCAFNSGSGRPYLCLLALEKINQPVVLKTIPHGPEDSWHVLLTPVFWKANQSYPVAAHCPHVT